MDAGVPERVARGRTGRELTRTPILWGRTAQTAAALTGSFLQAPNNLGHPVDERATAVWIEEHSTHLTAHAPVADQGRVVRLEEREGRIARARMTEERTRTLLVVRSNEHA